MNDLEFGYSSSLKKTAAGMMSMSSMNDHEYDYDAYDDDEDNDNDDHNYNDDNCGGDDKRR